MSRLEKLREDLEKRALLPNDPDSEWLLRVAESAETTSDAYWNDGANAIHRKHESLRSILEE